MEMDKATIADMLFDAEFEAIWEFLIFIAHKHTNILYDFALKYILRQNTIKNI